VNLSTVSATPRASLRAHAAPLAALLLGGLLVLLVGFSPLASVHNAAHDTRHSAGFPCH
jgi:cobalt transporter subunit CbtB